MRPSLRTEDFDTEKQVILEEIQMYERPAAVRHGRRHQGGSTSARIRWPAACWAPLDTITALSRRADAWLLRAPLQPRQHAASPRRANVDFRQAGGGRSRSAAAVGSRFDAERELPGAKVQAGVRIGRASEFHTSSTAATRPTRRRAKTPIALPRSCWPSIVGDDSGSRLYWDLVDPGSPKRRAWATTTTTASACFTRWISLCARRRRRMPQPCPAKFTNEFEAGGVTAEELAQAKSKVKSPRRAGQRTTAQPAVQRRRQLVDQPRVPHAEG